MPLCVGDGVNRAREYPRRDRQLENAKSLHQNLWTVELLRSIDSFLDKVFELNEKGSLARKDLSMGSGEIEPISAVNLTEFLMHT